MKITKTPVPLYPVPRFPMRLICVFMLCLLLLSCSLKNNKSVLSSPSDFSETATVDPLRLRAAAIASSLDDKLLAAQILICGIDGRGSLSTLSKDLLAEYPSGGIMLFRYNLNTENDAVRALIGETVSLIIEGCDIPPFIAVDHEGGTVNRFLRGVAALPSASSYWEIFLEEGKETALEKVRADSLSAGREINSLGINLNFAPVAEYLNDDNRDFLKNRSYGPDPSFTAEAAAAFVQSMEQSGVLCVLKHFPGSAGADPHHSASVINGNKAALDSLVSPFASLIKNGARAVMAAHTVVPAVDNKIASLSAPVMRNWLRDELKFDGIIISDDFIMAAAAGNYTSEEAAVLSVAAGSDMVLVWPGQISSTHSAFISALEDGRLSRDRLLDAVSRVIYEKLKMGLMKTEED